MAANPKQMTRAVSFFEIVAISCLCIYSIFGWLNQFKLSPDSANYITASINFIRTGRLFVFANWPSHSMEPEIEPYTDYPPGFPLYLAPFILIFQDPLLAATIAQSFAIIFFYLSIGLILQALKLQTSTRLGGMLVVTFLQTLVFIRSYFWTETLFISLSAAIGLCVIHIMRGEDSRRYWIMSALLLFLASLIRFTGVYNIAWFIPVILYQKIYKQTDPKDQIQRYVDSSLLIMKISVAALLPVVVWLLRNRLLYGYVTQSHHLFQAFSWEKLFSPFKWLYTYLFYSQFPDGVFIILGLLFLVVLPFFQATSKERVIHATLIFVLICHFTGVWVSSIFAEFNDLDSRLLSPAITIACLAVFNGLDTFTRNVKPYHLKILINLLPFIFFMFSTQATVISIEPGIIDYPTEKYLWQQLKKVDELTSSSHFYTDYDFTHQIFAGMPQRIIWDRLDLVKARKLLARGERPFFLLSQASSAKKALDQYIIQGDLQLQSMDFPEGFTLYYKP